jgi:hypothetical protein
MHAAISGHLNVLQWARAQQPPCPWGAQACLHFARDEATREWIGAQAALEGVPI